MGSCCSRDRRSQRCQCAAPADEDAIAMYTGVDMHANTEVHRHTATHNAHHTTTPESDTLRDEMDAPNPLQPRYASTDNDGQGGISSPLLHEQHSSAHASRYTSTNQTHNATRVEEPCDPVPEEEADEIAASSSMDSLDRTLFTLNLGILKDATMVSKHTDIWQWLSSGNVTVVTGVVEFPPCS